MSDEQWLWLNIRAQPPLPCLPTPEIQALYTGSTGPVTLRHAWRFYRFVKEIHPVSGERILDFGCGWGRITRFFLRHTDDLTGVDIDRRMIDWCRRTIPSVDFHVVPILPPSELGGELYGLAYAYSVFSHLPETNHALWLTELHRLIRPGGVLIATTRSRAFLQKAHPEAVDDYDAGRFVFVPTHGVEHFGEAAIPAAYAREHWGELFQVDFVTRPEIEQDIIVARKR